MKKTKEKMTASKYIGKIIFFSVGVLLGLIIGVCAIEYDIDLAAYFSLPTFVVLFFSLYIGFFVNIIIHEAGHLVFGLLSGYKFSSFRIFSCMILNENGKIRLKRHSLAGTGGQCLMIPPDMNDGRIPVTLYNFGGCIMNAIFAVVFLALSFVCGTGSFVSILMLLFSVTGILLALTNGIPMHTANIDNDGYNAFALRKNPEAMQGLWVQLKIVEQISKGVRLKDMPDEWFELPSDEAMKNSMVAARGVFVCNRLMDAESFEEADRLISHMLEIKSGMAGLHRNLLICDRMYIELITENRHDVIDGMISSELKKFMKAMKNYPSVIRTEYAVALLFEKDPVKAEKIMKRFEKIEKSYPYPCEIQGEKELMERAAAIAS